MSINKSPNNSEHLSNDEIYEFLRQHDDEKVLPTHIEQCHACHKQYDAAKLLFLKLKQDSQKTPNNDLWSRIEFQHKYQQQEKRNQIKHWSFVSVAASLLLVVGLQWNSLNNSQSLQNQIQAAIFQSQRLEQQTQNNLQPVNYQTNLLLNRELRIIDEDLQLAYQQNKRQEIILDLWKQRIQVLSRTNFMTDKAHNIETI